MHSSFVNPALSSHAGEGMKEINKEAMSTKKPDSTGTLQA